MMIIEKRLTGQSQLISPVSSLNAPSGPLVSSASTDFVWTTLGASDFSFSAPIAVSPFPVFIFTFVCSFDPDPGRLRTPESGDLVHGPGKGGWTYHHAYESVPLTNVNPKHSPGVLSNLIELPVFEIRDK